MEHFRKLPSEIDAEDNNRLVEFLWIQQIIEELKGKQLRRQQQQDKVKSNYGNR